MDARLDVEEFIEHFDLDRPEGSSSPSGACLIHLLGRVPQIRDRVEIPDLEIDRAHRRRPAGQEVQARPVDHQ